jgi:hypothetical protein
MRQVMPTSGSDQLMANGIQTDYFMSGEGIQAVEILTQDEAM